MRLWVDDVREPPKGYIWVRSVNVCIRKIKEAREQGIPIKVIDLDHDAGDFSEFGGGDYVKILDWLEEMGYSYPIRIHSMNPVGRENMRRIIRKNGWTEVHQILTEQRATL